MSGALEYLKGDLYVPNEKNLYCIEVKNYEACTATTPRYRPSLCAVISDHDHKDMNEPVLSSRTAAMSKRL